MSACSFSVGRRPAIAEINDCSWVRTRPTSTKINVRLIVKADFGRHTNGSDDLDFWTYEVVRLRIRGENAESQDD